jgi:hypothetical protein
MTGKARHWGSVTVLPRASGCSRATTAPRRNRFKATWRRSGGCRSAMAMPMSASPRLRASSTSDDPFTSVVKLTRRARPRWEAIRSGSTDSVSDSMQAMLTVPCQVPARDATSERKRSRSWSTFMTCRANISPTVVSVRPRALRSNKGDPTSCSSLRIWRLTADEATFSMRAAARIEPVRRTAWKYWMAGE